MGAARRRVASATDVHRPIPRVCCACHDPIPEHTLPMDIPDDDGTGGGSVERFCPSCFVLARAPLDPRWAAVAHRIRAIRCLACGQTSVDFGTGGCNACGSRSVLVIATTVRPKGGPVKAGMLRPLAIGRG